MKNVLFVVNTEGQLLTASSLIFERFNQQSGYCPYLLQVGKTGSARFFNPVQKALLTDKYWEVDRDDVNLRHAIGEILDTRFERVFIFLEQLGLNVFLVNYFHKYGSIICLGPDGNKPYYTVEKAAWGSRLQQTFLTYKYLFKRKLYYWRPYLLSWNYAKLSPVHELWVSYPDQFFLHRGKKVVGFKIMPNNDVVQKMIQFFNFDAHEQLEVTNGVIFYANNILYEESAYLVEMEVIEKLKVKFAGHPFYIKYHPATPLVQIERFKATGVKCFCNSKPAELYIASLKASVIIGFWSTSLMVDNPSCKFYWLHKYLVKSGHMIRHINLVNPTTHIRDVDNLDAITF